MFGLISVTITVPRLSKIMPLQDLQCSENTDPFEKGTAPVVSDSEMLIRLSFNSNARQGFELLFRRYYKILCSHAVRFVYSKAAAEDIVSDVYLNFWRTDAYEQVTSSYRAYLFKAVRNRALDYLHEEFRRESLLGKGIELDGARIASDDDPYRQLQLTQLHQLIETEIKSLPTQCQRVFILSRFEGKKQREIAEELQISTKTVESHINRALIQLRRVLHIIAQLLLLCLTHD